MSEDGLCPVCNRDDCDGEQVDAGDGVFPCPGPDSCPDRWEGGPHRWEPFNADGSRQFCYYCNAERDRPEETAP